MFHSFFAAIPAFFSTVLFLLSQSLSAQVNDPKIKYGKVSEAEMAMTTYAPDPAAPAVILFDKGVVTHRYNDTQGFMLEFERHKRVKILKKEGYGFADLAIFYYKGQKIQDLKATCYNLENGKVTETKLGGSNVFDEKLSSDHFVKKVAIPGVREGSILEFKYTISDEGIGLPVQEWIFQNPVAPTLWSEFKSSVPMFIDYKKFAQGWTPFTFTSEEPKEEKINIVYFERDNTAKVTVSSSKNIQVDYTANTMHFIQENVPALKAEPMVASVYDYLSKISFDVRATYQTSVVSFGTNYKLVNGSSKSYNRTWDGFGNSLIEDHYDDFLNGSRFTGAEAEKSVSGKINATEKTVAIYELIGKNYQPTVKDYFWKSQSMEDLTKNKKGTPTDLNLLFINMLRHVKLKAYPVLISTRPHGRATSYRVSTQEFDRVITAVALDDSTLTLIDASAWPSPIGILPVEAINGNGLLLKAKQDISWIPLQNKIVDRTAIVADLKIKPDGGILGKLTFSETGHAAVYARKAINLKSAQEYAVDEYKDLVAAGSLSELQVEGAQDWGSAVLEGEFYGRVQRLCDGFWQ